MLAQSTAAATTKDANAASATPAKPSGSSSTVEDTKSDAGNEAASTDPSAIAAALALLSQYMASPAASAANAAAQPPAPAEATQSSAAATSLHGVAATTATPAGSAATSAAGKDAQAATTTAQDLAALLVGDADDTKTAATAKDSTQSDGSSSGDSQTTPDNSGNSAGAAAAAALNPQVSIGSHFSTQPVPAHLSDVKSPVGSSAWADEVGGKVTWMAKQGIDSASLKLSPEHLGPVEVHISVQNGATSVMFGAAQADTRAALEQALPRLREMFAGQGLTLADAGVSREPPRQQGKPSPVAAVSGIAAISEDSTSVSTVMPVRLGLLDTYA